MAELLTQGLWRPDAKVICIECHMEQCGNDYGFMSKTKPIDHDKHLPRERGEYELEARCQVCKKKIWMMEKVALEQKVVLALQEKGKYGPGIHMQQTGGMCSAAEIMFPTSHKDNTNDYEFMWVTYAENEGDPLYYCGLYLTTEDGSGDTEDYVDHAMTFEEVLAWVDEQWREYEEKINEAINKGE